MEEHTPFPDPSGNGTIYGRTIGNPNGIALEDPLENPSRKGLAFERMYKLLLVTDNPKVQEAFAGIQSWAYLGFKEPRQAQSVDAAFDIMSCHHVDGVVLSMSDDDNHIFIERMNLKPLVPIVIEKEPVTRETVQQDVEMIGQLLNRTRADYSNDRYDEVEKMQMCRHEYFRKLLSGAVPTPEMARRNLLLVRSKMDPDVPCVIMELNMPDDEGYLQGKWAYGADRLEVAMRNIFGAEKNGMRVLVSVIDERRLFLTACPMIGEAYYRDPNEMLEKVREHAEAGIQHVREFLGIELEIASEEIRPSLVSLTEKGV